MLIQVMRPKWRSLCLFHIMIIPLLGTTEPAPEKTKIRDWDLSNRHVCSGTYNGRSVAGSRNRLDDLKLMYENCTRVFGNLEITHLTEQHLGFNSSQMRQKLTIFDHIEEIKGYLLIYNVNLQTLSFKRLRMIWGDDLLEERAGEKYSLMISSNHQLKEIYMPKLRSIENGNVRIENNTFLCHLRSKVNWDEILENKKDRLVLPANAFRQCDRPNGQPIEKCHKECVSGACWGQRLEMCQELYRTVCPDHCSQCYFNASTQAYECCKDTCAGGCVGPTDHDCVACKYQSLNGSCVSKCPPLKVHDVKRGQLVPNPGGTYINGRYCVKECPLQLLIEDSSCVRHCSVNTHHDMTKDSRQCLPCSGPCPKVCQVDQPLSGSLLKSLKDCEEIDGFLEIMDSHMTGPDGFTKDDLNVLRSVRMISEYVSIATRTHSPTNLSFLHNLEFIEGRSLSTQRYALVVSMNDNLSSLGLRSLHTIKAGDVFIGQNHRLCYASTVNWTRIVQEKAKFKIDQNRAQKNCEDRNRVCDKECDPAAGCWGEGPGMCVKCKEWNNNGTCVSACAPEGFYEHRDTRECKPCFEQCLRCNGPSEQDCLSCRNVAKIEDNVLTCLPECPITHYEHESHCYECHRSCLKFGCSGPQDHLGKGGCNKCEYAVEGNDENVERCLFTDGIHSEVCNDNNLTGYYTSSPRNANVEMLICRRCDEECDKCTSGGRNVHENGCQCKNFEQQEEDEDQCVTTCSTHTFLAKPRSADGPGVCKSCHEQCDKNQQCSGPLDTDCKMCAHAAVIINGTTVCIPTCPENAPYRVENDKMCYTEDVEAQQKNRSRLLFGLITIAFLLLFAIVSIIYCRCRKIKQKLLKVEIDNFGDMPETVPMDPTVRPNLSKVRLISTDELHTKNIHLGDGAFGIVYAGYWYPKGKGNLKLPVAIKLMTAPAKLRGKTEQDMLAEATKMAMVHHPNLVRLVGVCLKEDGIQLVTILRPLGDLLKFLKTHKTHLGGKDLLLYSYQIASAMKYLYEHRIVHRDLAARNVLVRRPNHVEVTDFGLAQTLRYGDNEVKVEEGKVAVKWLALEALNEQCYTHATDVWAYGVTVWEILTFGQSPYKGMDMYQIKQYLRDGNRLAQPNNCSSELYQVLLQCWMSNPESRPTFVVLFERFKEFFRVPHLYLGDCSSQSYSDISSQSDQRDLIREIMDDAAFGDDVADPLKYCDTAFGQELDSPTSSEQCMPRGIRRHTSTTSQRYQTDPMNRPNGGRPSELGMDDGNYLVPNAKIHEQQATLYTPVVVNEKGNSELVNRSEYYNEVGKSDYYNDVNRVKTADGLKEIAEEPEELEKESVL